jgi:diguanylate cyclase (GGDEF)-like protein
MRGNHHTKIWVHCAGVLVLAQVSVALFVHPGYAATTLTDLICAPLMALGIIAFGWNAFHSQGRVRLFWTLLAMAWAFLLSDQICWIFFDVIWRKPIPTLFAADALLFISQVPLLAGLLLRPQSVISTAKTRLGVVDFFLLMSWWIYLYLFFVVGWQYVTPDVPTYNVNYDLLYLVQNGVITVVLGLLWLRSANSWKKFYAIFVGCQVWYLLAFYLINRQIDRGLYVNGGWYDVGYETALCSFVFLAKMGQGLTAHPAEEDNKRYDRWMAYVAMLAVLSLPVMAAWATYDNGIPRTLVRFRVVATLATMAVMAFLVFVKQIRLGEALEKSNRVLEEASLTDPLTGVRNRRYFAATIEADIQQVLRSYADDNHRGARDLVFYLVDADNFKEVNDLYGHDSGDAVLVEMTRRISTAIRNSDVLVRWGGEEFLIVSRYTDRVEAETLASRVLAAAGDRPYFCKNGATEIFRTCSIGWAAFPWLPNHPEAVGYEEVLTLADLGLNQAKRNGKNCAIGMLPGTAKPGPLSSPRSAARLQFDVLSTNGPVRV